MFIYGLFLLLNLDFLDFTYTIIKFNNKNIKIIHREILK